MRNVVLVGVGPLTQRVYLELIKKYKCNLKLVIDFKSKKTDILNILDRYGYKDFVFFGVIDNSNDGENAITDKEKDEISSLLLKYQINYAIIATEPKAHFAFSKLMLLNNINILLEKPIIAVKNIITEDCQIKLMEHQMNYLCSLYLQKKASHGLKFCIMTQRRYHKGHLFVQDTIKELIAKYNVGINSLTINACDGMWNMPNELDREYHPYKYGYGKLFHSGYHHIDLLCFYLRLNDLLIGQKISNTEINSQAYYPKDFVGNLNNREYINIFGQNRYEKIFKSMCLDGYGELDIHSLISFKKKDKISAIANINLMQSGFSRRSWMDLPKDVYKGNGRIKHEFIDIEVGPLASIKLMSFQAKTADEGNEGFDLGDNDHFLIQIFRNSKLIGGSSVDEYNLKDIIKSEGCDDYNLQTREALFKDYISGNGEVSDIMSHIPTMQLVYGIYQSLALKESVKDAFSFKPQLTEKPIVVFDSEGTIKQGSNISGNVLQALTNLKEYGIITCLATGLPLEISKGIAKSCNADYIIAIGGACIFDMKYNKIIFSDILSRNYLAYLYEYSQKFDFCFSCVDGMYSTSVNDITANTKYMPFEKIMLRTESVLQVRVRIHQLTHNDTLYEIKNQVDDFYTLKGDETFMYEKQLFINKYMLQKDLIAQYHMAQFFLLKELMKETNKRNDVHVLNKSVNFENYGTDYETSWFTVVNKVNNKGCAVKKLLDRLSLSNKCCVLALGNDYNDKEMLEIADISVNINDTIGEKSELVNNKNLEIKQRYIDRVINLYCEFYINDMLDWFKYNICDKMFMDANYLFIMKTLNDPLNPNDKMKKILDKLKGVNDD